MLILWGLMNVYIIICFAIFGLIGAGYLAAYVVRRVRDRRVFRPTLPAGGVRRAYTDDALKAA